MLISNKLPQFTNTVALLASASRQDARLFVATNGVIEEIDAFKTEKPHYSNDFLYSNRFGLFEARTAKEGMTGGGSLVRPLDEIVLYDFMKELGTHLQGVAQRFQVQDIYLFVPDYLHNLELHAFPPALRRKVVAILYGDFHYHHPFRLLTTIKERLQKLPTRPLKREAQKLLHRPDILRKSWSRRQ